MPIIFDKGRDHASVMCVHPGLEYNNNNNNNAEGDHHEDDHVEYYDDGDHDSVTSISRVWRGFKTRRDVKSHQILEEYQTKRVVRIQCWYRRLRARQRCRSLSLARDAARKNNQLEYEKELLRDVDMLAMWKPTEVQEAAHVLTCVFRGCIDDVGTSSDPVTRYRAARGVSMTLEAKEACLARAVEENQCRRRHKEEMDAYWVSHTAPTKTVGLDAACTIQRAYRVHAAKLHVQTLRISREYFNRHARTVQRAWRCCAAKLMLKRLRAHKEWRRGCDRKAYEQQLVDMWSSEVTWRKIQCTHAATMIQITWRAKKK
eukprot:PhM_4_TR15466/c0_g1_i1/m.74909